MIVLDSKYQNKILSCTKCFNVQYSLVLNGSNSKKSPRNNKEWVFKWQICLELRPWALFGINKYISSRETSIAQSFILIVYIYVYNYIITRHHFSFMTGSVLQTVTIPGSLNTTSCCFGGPDYTELYVTTCAIGVKPEVKEQNTCAGSVFRVTGLGVRGVAPYEYGK